MSKTIASPQTPSGNPRRVTFQSTLNSEVKTTRSSNEGPTTPICTVKNRALRKQSYTALH